MQPFMIACPAIRRPVTPARRRRLDARTIPRVRHVSGTAVYIDDLREPAGTLHIAPRRPPAARGRVVKLDLDAVRAAPGVVAVLTARMFPARTTSVR